MPVTYRNLQSGAVLWRAGLPALGREAALEPVFAVYQVEQGGRFYDCCVAERGGAAFRQARSPQILARLKIALN